VIVPAVHKFGGTSLADAACFRRVAEIVARWPTPRRAVVVSAMSGVTSALLSAVETAAAPEAGDYEALLEALGRRHVDTIAALVPPDVAESLGAALARDLAEIADVLHASTLLRRSSREARQPLHVESQLSVRRPLLGSVPRSPFGDTEFQSR